MSTQVALFVIGAVLLLISILGGGIEVKELKIPRLNKGPRVGAGAAGLVFVFLGILLESAHAVDPGPQPEMAAEPITFYVIDSLGENQISEQVRILIDGQEAGTLTVDENFPKTRLPIRVPEAGRYSYVIEAQGVFALEDGGKGEFAGAGQGAINAVDGKTFELAATITGETWMAHLEEVTPQ
jgi:hypothetical protein